MNIYRMRSPNLKLSSCLLVICCLFASLSGQEGKAYIGTNEVIERTFDVRQKYGRNVMTLATKSIGIYDSLGYIQETQIYQANLSYLGRRIRNVSQSPTSVEILDYNYMNMLSSRSVEVFGTDPRESTVVVYDTKGKILQKSSTRVHEISQETWNLEYNQVGYVNQYFQIIQDKQQRVMLKNKFNYYDDLVEKHYYIYNDMQHLIQILAMSASDSSTTAISLVPAPADTMIFRREYSYDDNANLTEERLYNHKGQITESEAFVYDDRNRVIQRSYYIWNPRFGTIPNLRKQVEYAYQ